MSLFIDDPTPTTGGPVDYQLPEGCACHIREYTDVGDQRYAPPEGCRVHTPWAFPGYVLGEEPAPHPGSRALLGIAPDGMGIDELPEADVECCGGACPCRGEPV